MTEQQTTLAEGSLLAALDLGSNSFHLIVARVEHGELRPVETLAEKVQLGAGMNNDELAADAIERGLDCLGRFAQMLASLDIQRLRAVGTHALRIARNRRQFTNPARELLGAPIEVIYGREEARLVYLGVAHTLADDAQSRLVVDIGGGSTEFIIGERFEPRVMESLQIGCVSYTNRFFPDGKISSAAYSRACNEAILTISSIRHNFHHQHWQECVGASGTLQTIEELLLLNGWSDNGIDTAGLARLEQELLAFDAMDNINLDGLAESRRNVIVAGTAITRALFNAFHIEHMRTSRGALREGVLYDLLGRLTHEDVRERTVSALMQRYGADGDIAANVERRARVFYTATRKSWQLDHQDWELLHWVARCHELGMAISHKHYNRHSAYLLRNSDLPGFSLDEQERLALLAQAHRGKLNDTLFTDTPEPEQPRVKRLVSIIRLAVLFKYVEQLEQLPEFSIQVSTDALTLEFPAQWLQEHPLTAAELQGEQNQLAKIGLELNFS
ncbi:MAG: Ppx/GppA family phosphatase [Halioglobus sp.]